MKSYELTCLISPELSSEELDSLREKIISFLQEEKGILVKIDELTKKNLYSPVIKKNQAFLLSLEFQLNPENLENLREKLRKEQQILRYFLIVKKPAKVVEITKRPPKFPKKIEKPKVELKEIEKKLEEILGE